MIKFSPENKTFYLNTKNSSYIINILDNGLLCHKYYGASVAEDNMEYYNLFAKHEYTPNMILNGYTFSKDNLPQEYPVFGRGDFRSPAVCVERPDGRCVNDLIYKSHEITAGVPKIEGLPYFNKNTEGTATLKIVLTDCVSGFESALFYSVFENEDAITRHTVITNTTDKSLKLRSADSLSVDFEAKEFDFLTLRGAWARERHINRRSLSYGTTSIESRRGSSGHQHNPFAALISRNTTEESGEAYGFALVYSGNFRISAEVDQFSSTRLQMGINPNGFTYVLSPGESFTTPQAVSVYSNSGLCGMSHSFHNMCKNHLGRSAEKAVKHPIIINSWEAIYFDITEKRIENLVRSCRGLGIDTFVLDDGWFGCRKSDNSSLGDWYIDKNKFPNGLNNIISICKENGMSFGIWFEPEMISENSELYRRHPDWCIHTPGCAPIESRSQLVLDMARSEVVDCIYNQLAALLNEYDITYVKWDMNRNITDNGSASLSADAQGEHAHRYILGVYSLMDRLTKAFPDVLFEGCAGGGGRFDFGILYYMPQIWTSDDTDAVERLKIQYGTSMVYPVSAMTAHVSACPNHQTGRITPFKTRGDIAQICNFGYELDASKLSSDETEQIKEQIKLHRKIEPMIYNGDFYRLISPFESDCCCWQIAAQDKKISAVVFATQKATPNSGGFYIKLRGLDPESIYTVSPMNIKLHGKTLMNAGLPITKEYFDFNTAIFELTAE